MPIQINAATRLQQAALGDPLPPDFKAIFDVVRPTGVRLTQDQKRPDGKYKLNHQQNSDFLLKIIDLYGAPKVHYEKNRIVHREFNVIKNQTLCVDYDASGVDLKAVIYLA